MNPPRSLPAISSSPDELFLRLQTALAGEYSLERELGRGGTGIVYLAREVRLAREVAIKVLPPALAADPERRAQFLREAQTAAGLSHPNIVPIHRVDEAQGFVYFVMAYVAGETLAQRIAERGPLPPHQSGRVLREVAWALAYSHANAIVHRDVKADNVMLERATGRALVTDFGIAAVAHTDARSDDGHIAGSPHYASPEQIAGQPLDAASDLYSLGVAGFFMLTGRLPFDAATAREVVAMHLNMRAPSITSLAPTVPAKLAQLVERCLAKRPEDRPASAAAFADALEQVVEPPREVPAPLRVWLTHANHGSVARRVLAAYLGIGVVAGVTASGAVIPGIGAGVLIAAGIAFLPPLIRTNRLLAAGYDIDDLRVAIREHWMRRREEAAYELSAPVGGVSGKIALGIFGFSAITTTLLQALGGVATSGLVGPMTALAATFAVASGVFTIGRIVRLKLSPQLGSRQIKFYESKWGERFVRLAGFGLKKRAPSQTLSQLTEVALGRATDALYDALPKATQKQLKQLPATVRRLEEDAKALRAEIQKLDDSLIALDGDAANAMPSAIAASEHESRVRAERDRLRADLQITHDRASGRLAATVAALETIRLDLLRLQLGEGRVESVTASLDAAREVAADLGAYVDASEEVERWLRPAPPLTPRTSVP
ncbi:MAG TPA: protein kinase [Gemmatimonadaceae bacterium]